MQNTSIIAIVLAAAPCMASEGAGPIEIRPGVAQLFVDDLLIDSHEGLRRTLHPPRKDNGGEIPIIAPPGLQTLMASGTIVRDPRLGAYVMFAHGFWEPPAGRYQVGMFRFTSPDGMIWRMGEDGKPEHIPIDLTDPASGRKATNIDLFSCYYDLRDAEFPYKGWLYFANWGDDLEGVHYMRSRDGRAWERVRQIVDAWAGGADPTHREIRQDDRVLRGPGDVTIFYRDEEAGRFLGIFKFFSVAPVGPGNRLRSRAYSFFDRLDEPFDTTRLERIALLPPAADANGDLPHDEYYASTAWRYESMWLGGLKVWHGGGDYPYSAAGCAFLKLVSSRGGLTWRKVQFSNDDGIPEVFIPNGPEGGNGGRNDGGYMTEFSQGPLRIGDELIFYYGSSSYGKNHKPRVRISGGGIFRARLRIDGFVSVDAGTLVTKPLAFAGTELALNAIGPVGVEALDADGKVLGSASVAGDSLRHEIRFGGKSLREIAPSGVARLRFNVSPGGRLHSFRIDDRVSGSAPRAIGSRWEPFADSWLVDRLDGARMRLHTPIPREVVFRFDAPWEGGQSAYVTVLHDGDGYRMYYRGGGDLGREYTCLALSDDGIRWTRPSLGLFEFQGSTENNIIWTGKNKAYDESHNFSPFIDANPAAPPAERWKAVTLDKWGEGEARKKVLSAFVSGDGIRWRRLREEPIISEGGFDSHNTAFWDPLRAHYVCYLRMARDGKRSIARASSPDFRNWSRPELLDFGGAPNEQFYTNGILPYFRAPHIFLGFPMRFVPPKERGTVGLDRRKTDGLSDAVFMASRDGLRWERTFLEAFIRPGLDPKNWGGAHGNSTPAWGILQTAPTEISIYWSEHYDNYPEKEITPQLRRGTLRLDGFVSINAPYAGGVMVTKPFLFEGKHLLMDLSTSAVGSIRVEIREAGGRPLPGFALEDAVEIWGDEIERVAEWKSGTDVGALAGRPVRLRFALKDADLYAIRFR